MSSVLLGGPPGGDSQSPSTAPTAPFPAQAPPTATGSSGQRGNAVTVIAGVGVLLLAMGIGVLIGRAGNSKPVAAPAQVISVAQPGATSTGAVSTPTTTTPEAATKGGSAASKKGSKKGASGAGSSISKPAPPTVLKGLHSTKGKGYEEKSKNLPNVIETG